MPTTAIVHATVYTPVEVIRDGAVVFDEWIRYVGPTAQVDLRGVDRVIEAEGRPVSPGLIDLQVNGAGGYNVMSADPAALRRLAGYLPRAGCTAFLPTVVTATRERMVAALEAIARVRAEGPDGARLLGAHVEGPYLSPVRHGAHDPALIRPFDAEEWSLLQQAAGGTIRLVTLAPDIPENLAAIPRLREAGVVVSLGHTDATYDQVVAAIQAGATMATHVYNAMRGLHQREPGALGAALDRPELMAGLIADGVHVHPAAVRLLLRAKGVGRVVCVSDAAWVAGLPPGTYAWEGRQVVFDGRAPRLADGTLAGSGTLLDQMLRNLLAFGDLTPQQALWTMTLTPARALGQGPGMGLLAGGRAADLVLWEGDWTVRQTFVAGRAVYERGAV